MAATSVHQGYITAQPISGHFHRVTSTGGTLNGNNGGRNLRETVPHYRLRCHGLHGAVCGGGGRPMRRRKSRRLFKMGRGREKQTAAGRSAETSRGKAVYVLTGSVASCDRSVLCQTRDGQTHHSPELLLLSLARIIEYV